MMKTTKDLPADSLPNKNEGSKAKTRATPRVFDRLPIKRPHTGIMNSKLQKPSFLLNHGLQKSSKLNFAAKFRNSLNFRKNQTNLVRKKIIERLKGIESNPRCANIRSYNKNNDYFDKKPKTAKNADRQPILFDSIKHTGDIKIQQDQGNRMLPRKLLNKSNKETSKKLKESNGLELELSNIKNIKPNRIKELEINIDEISNLKVTKNYKELYLELLGRYPNTAPNLIGKSRELFLSPNNRKQQNAQDQQDTPSVKVQLDNLQEYEPTQNSTRIFCSEYFEIENKTLDQKQIKKSKAKESQLTSTNESNSIKSELMPKPFTSNNTNAKKSFFANNIEKTHSVRKLPVLGCQIQSKVDNVIRFENIKNWRTFCGKLNALESFLFNFLGAIERDGNVYEIIRRYVDFIQDKKFNDLPAIIVEQNYRKIITENFILERWAIFAVFYIGMEKLLSRKKRIAQRITVLIYQNFLDYIKLIYLEQDNCNNLAATKLFSSFIDRSIIPKNSDFYSVKQSKKELLTHMTKNNQELKKFLQNITETANAVISEGIVHFLNSIKKLEIDESLEYLLETFCDYFVRKGIVTVESDGNQLLPSMAAEEPYIRKPMQASQEYTLILDLDETLVHYDQSPEGGHVLLRPYVHRFLEEMGKHYEIVIFTAAQQDYADWIIDRLDKGKNVTHRLYRQHTYLHENVNIKNLDRIGRAITKTIIIDNLADNFRLHQENGIWVESWFDDPKDTVLLGLIPHLKGKFSRYCDKTTPRCQRSFEIN